MSNNRPSSDRLYRDTEQGRVAGVCAGVATFFGMETWLVRIIAVSVTILNFGLFVLAYGAAWLLLDKKPLASVGTEAGSEHELKIKAKPWQAGTPPKKALQQMTQRYGQLEGRLQLLERYVTSKEFRLHREFKKL